MAALFFALLPVRSSEAGTRLNYELWQGGFHAFDLEFQMTNVENGYRLAFAAHTRGLIGWLLSYDVRATSVGRRETQHARPQRFESRSRKRGRERTRWIDYLENQVPQVAFRPPLKRAPAEQVPAARRKGTIDPVSAFYSVIEAFARSGRCAMDVTIFDGRKLYRLRTEDIGADRVAANRYGLFAGPAQLCRAKVEKLLGFKRKKPLLAFVPSEIDIWMAPLPGLAQAVPVRLAGDTELGRMIVHLVDFRASAEVSDRTAR